MKLRGGCIFLPRYTRNGETHVGRTWMIGIYGGGECRALEARINGTLEQ